MIEWGIPSSVYGCPENGQIGKYQCEDFSNGAHITSSDLIQAYISNYIAIGKYLIKQSETPFAPRNHEDLSFAPLCPEKDLALVGAKISEVGSGKPGCLSVDSEGWDILPYGTKQITFNAQNNGRLPAAVNCTLTICNKSADPECINPDDFTFQETNVPPYVVKTFTHVTDLAKGSEYAVTIRTVDEASTLDNDLKRFVFRTTSDDTTTTTTQPTTTTTTIPVEECSASVISTILPLNAGLLPHVRRIVITGDGSNWGRSTAVSIEDIPIVIPLRVQPNKIIAFIVIPSTLTGFTPGEKEVGVASGAELCTGTVDIQ